MKHREEEHEREILHEAFLAGWQAALGTIIRNPRVLAVIDSCFEQWLGEAADETEVLGLMFRGRYDLPASVLTASPLAVELTHGKNPHPVDQSETRVNGHASDFDAPRRETA